MCSTPASTHCKSRKGSKNKENSPNPTTKIFLLPKDKPSEFSKASGIKPFIPKLEESIFAHFTGQFQKRTNLRELRLKLFEIPHQHLQFLHSFFIPFPFENLPEMKIGVFTGLRSHQEVKLLKNNKKLTAKLPLHHQS